LRLSPSDEFETDAVAMPVDDDRVAELLTLVPVTNPERVRFASKTAGEP